MTTGRCQRLVVVVGSADPVLESTLIYVGLHPVHAGGDLTVWAPLDWELGWLELGRGSDGRTASGDWGDGPRSATYPYTAYPEEHHA